MITISKFLFEAVTKCKHANKPFGCTSSFPAGFLSSSVFSDDRIKQTRSCHHHSVALWCPQPNIRLVEDVKFKGGPLKRWVTHWLSFSFCLFFLAQYRQSTPHPNDSDRFVQRCPPWCKRSHLGFNETLVATGKAARRDARLVGCCC